VRASPSNGYGAQEHPDGAPFVHGYLTTHPICNASKGAPTPDVKLVIQHLLDVITAAPGRTTFNLTANTSRM
jgi:hypothetical protein